MEFLLLCLVSVLFVFTAGAYFAGRGGTRAVPSAPRRTDVRQPTHPSSGSCGAGARRRGSRRPRRLHWNPIYGEIALVLALATARPLPGRLDGPRGTVDGTATVSEPTTRATRSRASASVARARRGQTTPWQRPSSRTCAAPRELRREAARRSR